MVARSRKMRWPDCSPPERPAVLVEGLENVAVADLGLMDLHPGVGHGQVEAKIGHDGHHHGVAGQPASPLQVQGEEAEQPVAVDDRPGLVDGDDPVGVPIEGQPGVGPRATTDAAEAGTDRSIRSRR